MKNKEIIAIITPHIICSQWVDLRGSDVSTFDVETESNVNIKVDGEICVVILPFIVAMKLFPESKLKGMFLQQKEKNFVHTGIARNKGEKEDQIKNSILNIAYILQNLL